MDHAPGERQACARRARSSAGRQKLRGMKPNSCAPARAREPRPAAMRAAAQLGDTSGRDSATRPSVLAMWVLRASELMLRLVFDTAGVSRRSTMMCDLRGYCGGRGAHPAKWLMRWWRFRRITRSSLTDVSVQATSQSAESSCDTSRCSARAASSTTPQRQCARFTTTRRRVLRRFSALLRRVRMQRGSAQFIGAEEPSGAEVIFCGARQDARPSGPGKLHKDSLSPPVPPRGAAPVYGWWLIRYTAPSSPRRHGAQGCDALLLLPHHRRVAQLAAAWP